MSDGIQLIVLVFTTASCGLLILGGYSMVAGGTSKSTTLPKLLRSSAARSVLGVTETAAGVAGVMALLRFVDQIFLFLPALLYLLFGVFLLSRLSLEGQGASCNCFGAERVGVATILRALTGFAATATAASAIRPVEFFQETPTSSLFFAVLASAAVLTVARYVPSSTVDPPRQLL